MPTQPHFSMPESPMPFKSTADKALGITRLLALSVFIIMRVNIGLDRLSYSQLAAVTALMLVASGFGNIHFGFSLFSGLQVLHGSDNSLFYYAFLVLWLGIWQRRKRLQEEKRGTEPHTYWPGDGRLYGFIPLERKYIDMLVEPALVFLAGAVLRYRLGCGLLGLWLMASAVALCITEKMWQGEENKFIRTRNNLRKEAEWEAKHERMRPKGTAVKNDGAQSSVTIPTGNDDALAALIKKNKQDNAFLS